ncbi:MAG: hypothetical protein HY360_07050 [Verrucomicrobia bacterium]|nr:hypothetical protein [Verrucomicrobiota bacterium]
MKSPYFNIQPPYRLPSNIVYFHDWRYVNTGGYAWLGPKAEGVPMMAPGPVPPMHYEYRDMPLGIRLEAESARKSECVLHAKTTGDVALFGGSQIKEDGVHRLWCETWLKEDFADKTRIGMFNALRYMESDDGIHWKPPSAGQRRFRGGRNHNVVYGSTHTPETGFHGGSVFVDPSAPKSERYKAFHLGKAKAKAIEAYYRKQPDEIDPHTAPTLKHHGFAYALFGAVSPDGIRWKALPEPLLVMNSDTHNICEYDSVLKKYVAYVRTWFFHHRSIGRTMSPDFRSFPLPEEVFWPDASQAPYDTWYCNGKTVMPGAPDYHVIFPMRWSLPTDHFEFHLAASPDNLRWGFVPGGAVCKPGEPNGWDAGVVAPGKGMVEWGKDRIGILYAGTPVPHKYPRRPPLGGLAWAWWPKGRLAALKCPLEGSFALWPLLFRGQTVHLNFRTTMTGYAQVEARVDGKTLPGRSFADCDPLSGDHLDQPVTWRGKKHLGHKDGTAVELRFRLRNADLYAIEFK